jgi:hypothetical protein
MLGETQIQFPLTRAALSTGGSAKSNFPAVFSGGLLQILVICTALLLAAGCATEAPSGNSGVQSAKVVYKKGDLRYSTGNNVWQPLNLGDVVRHGTLIQTAADSRVTLVLGDVSAPVARPMRSDMFSYHPLAEQSIVRLWENTLMGVDKLTEMRTGEAVVTETALDLKAGHITGSVKKMTAASKYEVKLPNGVAGIKGTVYECYAEGIVKVREGSMVVAYTGANGSIVTQVVMSLQMFDIRTGTHSQIPDLSRDLPVIRRY